MTEFNFCVWWVFVRRPLSSYHPALHKLRVWQRQVSRHLYWRFSRVEFATSYSENPLPYRTYRHQSKLKRQLSEASDEMMWQQNKIENHRLALPHLNGVLMRPGQTLSLWRLIGPPTQARGFKIGMELHQGRARGGVGGGLCQIANLVHWLALHSPLTVTQRAAHSVDPFPDQGRVIPYGTGAALFYNYIDLWIFNPTDQVFQLNLWLTDTLINGDIRTDRPAKTRFHVREENGHFTQHGRNWMRHNEIWRDEITKGQNAQVIRSEKLYENHVKVLYEPKTES